MVQKHRTTSTINFHQLSKQEVSAENRNIICLCLFQIRFKRKADLSLLFHHSRQKCRMTRDDSYANCFGFPCLKKRMRLNKQRKDFKKCHLEQARQLSETYVLVNLWFSKRSPTSRSPLLAFLLLLTPRSGPDLLPAAASGNRGACVHKHRLLLVKQMCPQAQTGQKPSNEINK